MLRIPQLWGVVARTYGENYYMGGADEAGYVNQYGLSRKVDSLIYSQLIC